MLQHHQRVSQEVVGSVAQFKKASLNSTEAALLATTTPLFIEDIPPVGDVQHKPRNRYRSRGRQFRHGQRAAVLRAVTAARAYLHGEFSSLAEAADGCGSCPTYIAAAIVVLQSEDIQLLNSVLGGRGSLLGAAKTVKRLAALVTAWRAASTRERRWFGPIVGVGLLWDQVIAPNV